MKKIQHILLLGALLVGTFALTQSFSSQVSPVYAFTSCNTAARNAQGTVHGQAWSSNIGWVYLNCADFVGVPTPDFGVSEDVNGKWTGYGWSSNIGWLQFGGTGGPSGILPATGVSSVEIQRVFKDGVPDPVVGWARFLANGGGWDGWVSFHTLNDQNGTLAGVQTGTGIVPITNYGISIDDVSVPPVGNTTINRAIGGFTWGSTVVGWLHFSKDDVYVIDPVTRPPTIALTASPLTTTYPNYQTTLTYSITSADSAKFNSAQTCTGTASTASGLPWVSTTLPGVGGATLSQAIPLVNVPTSPTRFTITCPIVGGGTATNYVDVTRLTLTEITLSGGGNICETGSVNQSQKTTFTWTSSVTGAQSCSLFQDNVAIYSGGLNGSKEVGPFSTNNVAGEQKVFTVKCFAGPNGTGALVGNVSNAQTVTVWPSATNNGTIRCNQPDDTNQVSVEISAGGPICPSGTANGTTTTIDWTTRGNDTPPYSYCKISRNGTAYPANYGLAGSATVSQTGTYQVTCYKADGSAPVTSDTVTIATNCTDSMRNNAGSRDFCPEGAPYGPYLPFDAKWGTNADSCIFRGPGLTGPILSTEIEDVYEIQTTGIYRLTCEYPSGNRQTVSWGVDLLAPDDTRCTTRPPAVTRPIIKER